METLFFVACILHRRQYIRRRRLSILLLNLLLLRRRYQLRPRHYLTRSCLLSYDNIEWHKLFRDGSDVNLINVISLTRIAFEYLLPHFSRYYIIKAGNDRRGRRPALQHKSTVLALLLSFYCDECGHKTLCRLFGIPPATLSRTLKKAEIALQKALRVIPEAAILWPSLDQQREWAQKVKDKNILIEGRWGFIDGKNYRVQKPSASDIQNACYNGWLHATLITGCFCFGVDGTLCWGKHNIVGSWNDGDISRPFQDKLLDDTINVPGHGVLSDSAFPVRNGLEGRIITPLKDGDLEKQPVNLQQLIQLISNAITSMRQSCEWGMGSVEKVYRRLLQKLPFDQDVRARRLDVIYRLFNFRVRTTGISQIRSYFYNN